MTSLCALIVFSIKNENNNILYLKYVLLITIPSVLRSIQDQLMHQTDAKSVNVPNLILLFVQKVKYEFVHTNIK